MVNPTLTSPVNIPFDAGQSNAERLESHCTPNRRGTRSRRAGTRDRALYCTELLKDTLSYPVWAGVMYGADSSVVNS
jgi:hypothetical protein